MNTIRASDSEREEVARILQKAAGAGRLSPEEAGERLAQAQSARFREELADLISDLPETVDLNGPPTVYRRPPTGAWLAWRLLRVGLFAMLFVGLLGLFRLRWFFFPFFFPVWPLAFLLIGALVFRRRWGWRRRMYWRGPYWRQTRYEF